MIIGIDIGGTHFRIGQIENGKVLSSKKIKTSDVIKSENVTDDLSMFLSDYIKGLKVDAISIGFPATISKDQKKVVQLPNVKAINNIPVVDELEKALHIPVFIERDANICLYYDINKYQIKDAECIVGIYFGTGVGSSIFINGKPYNGANGTAGEIGHIPVDKVTTICGCGNVGCMETVAGGRYLQEINEKIFKDNIADIFIKHVDDELIVEYIDRMSIAIATYINILNPDYILVGGGIINMKNFPINKLKERIIYHTRKPEPANSLNLIFVDDEDDKGIVGAYYRTMI